MVSMVIIEVGVPTPYGYRVRYQDSGIQINCFEFEFSTNRSHRTQVTVTVKFKVVRLSATQLCGTVCLHIIDRLSSDSQLHARRQCHLSPIMHGNVRDHKTVV